MLTINLLPNEEKSEILLEKWRYAICFLTAVLSMVFIIALALLTPAYLPLLFQRKELQRALDIERQAMRLKDTDQFRAQVNTIKSAIAGVQTSSSVPSAADIIETSFQPVKNISITSVSTRKGGLITISGVARTRNDLLDYEQHLMQTGKFQGIAAPLSNIIKDTNINFSFEGQLKHQYSL